MFHANYFRTAAIDSLGDTAIAYTLTAARWGVLGWEWYTESFFSAKAKARYQLIGETLGHCLILALLGWRMAQQWAEGEVSAALPTNDHIVGVNKMVEADPFCPTVNPLPVTGRSRVACSHCDGFGRVGVNGAYTCPKCHGRKTIMAIAAPALEGMTIRELKAQAKAAKVPNYGRMTKAQLVQALAG